MGVKHIGVVACSAEGAALCYRTICSEGRARLGEHAHPEITLHTHPLAQYMACIRSGNWRGVADLMLSSTRKVAGAGAAFAICPDNTIHQAFDLVAAESPIPWLHIARVVADEASRAGYRQLGILGTRFLMEGPVYVEAARERGLETLTPDAPDRERVNTIILDELVYGVLREPSRVYFHDLIDRLAERGCHAVVLGCTEIPLIVQPERASVPTLDSTRLLARAALRHATEEG
jgi:aspartate racemase